MISRKQILLASCLVVCASMLAKITHISSEDDYNKALKGCDRLVVKFSADWCSVCNGTQKPFEEVASEEEFGHIQFAQVDVDKLDSISKQNGIVGVPTFVYVENGSKKVEEIGVQNMPAFKDDLRKKLRKNFDKSDMSAQKPQAEEITIFEEDEVKAPDAPAAESNILVKTLMTIKDFILVIILKIKDFFVTIFSTITGFFK